MSRDTAVLIGIAREVPHRALVLENTLSLAQHIEKRSI